MIGSAGGRAQGEKLRKRAIDALCKNHQLEQENGFIPKELLRKE